MADDFRPLFNDKVTVLLFAMGSAAFVVTMYHLIAVCLCAHRFRVQKREQTRRDDRNFVTGTPQTPGINESSSVAHLIPAHKYQKRKDVAEEDDGTCAVCLGDFEEGEELKTMPECMHSFHVPCIDMWLYSHSSCPICRTDATLSPVHRILVPVS